MHDQHGRTRVVEWSAEVILRPFHHLKWDVSASEPDEIPTEWKGFFRSAVNLIMPGGVLSTRRHEPIHEPRLWSTIEASDDFNRTGSKDKEESDGTYIHADP